MNKLFFAIIPFLCFAIVILFTILVAYFILNVFVTIRNAKLLEALYNSNKLSWFTEDGRYRSLRERTRIGKERARITKELVNSERNDVKNKKLFRFLVNAENVVLFSMKAIAVLFFAVLILAFVLSRFS